MVKPSIHRLFDILTSHSLSENVDKHNMAGFYTICPISVFSVLVFFYGCGKSLNVMDAFSIVSDSVAMITTTIVLRDREFGHPRLGNVKIELNHNE
ncbi:hypothetical protein BCU12_12755 [Vibrio sp. 10N.261.55.A7]|nr:hypothetical protein BCU12_12755 [Vibrio sp. 10N.261.55.A7]